MNEKKSAHNAVHSVTIFFARSPIDLWVVATSFHDMDVRMETQQKK